MSNIWSVRYQKLSAETWNLLEMIVNLLSIIAGASEPMAKSMLVKLNEFECREWIETVDTTVTGVYKKFARDLRIFGLTYSPATYARMFWKFQTQRTQLFQDRCCDYLQIMTKIYLFFFFSGIYPLLGDQLMQKCNFLDSICYFFEKYITSNVLVTKTYRW